MARRILSGPVGSAAPWVAACGLLFIGLSWLGVAPADTARYLTYEAAFTILPGWLAYRIVLPNDHSRSRQIAVGWALGYALSITAFNLSAALGARPLFLAWPLLAVGAGLVIVRPWQRRPAPVPSGQGFGTPATSAALAGLLAMAWCYLTVSYVARTPLPGSVGAVDYHVDLPYHLSLAAEALHHWPIMNPSQAGEPLVYYTFTYSHLAGIAQVTGIALPVVLMRLYLVGLTAAITLQSYALGRQVGRGRLAGVLAVGLLFFVGEIDFSLTEGATFNNAFLEYFAISPSFTLGLVFFLPTCLMAARVVGRRVHARAWSVVALLILACAFTKASPLPLLVGALALLAVSEVWRVRRLSGGTAAAMLTAALVLAVFYVLVYREVESVFEFAPFASVRRAVYFDEFWNRAGGLGLPRAAYDAALAGPALLGFAALQFIGAAWLVWRLRGRMTQAQMLHASLAVIGVAAFMLLSYSNFGQLLYLYYAFPSICALAAFGLIGITAGLRRRRAWPRLAVGALLAALLLAQLSDPLTDSRLTLYRWRTGQPTYSQAFGALSADLWRALSWLRANTSVDDVLAVNNQRVDKTIYLRPTYHNTYYSAFGERRVFYEGWEFRAERYRALGEPPPYRDRAALNARVFEQADAAALGQLARDYGVRYLLVDKEHAPASPDLDRLATRVFASPGADVYRVPASQ